MKPKNLKFPYSWENRQPALYEGVLIVPQYYEGHEDFSESFLPPQKMIHIEYCSGNGDWIIEKALENPLIYWVAVEKQFERVRKIWSKMHNCNVKNLLIVCGEAQTFTQHYLPENSVDAFYVNFPDPWPKPRHAKHRLIQEPFVRELSRISKKGGTATFATDHPLYSMQMIDEMQRSKNWKSIFDAPYYKSSLEEYGNSWFRALWEKLERNFYYIQFEKE